MLLEPDVGGEIAEAGLGPKGLKQTVTYERGDVRLELTATKRKNGPTKYIFNGIKAAPIFVECKCCHKVFHASQFIVKHGHISVRNKQNNDCQTISHRVVSKRNTDEFTHAMSL